MSTDNLISRLKEENHTDFLHVCAPMVRYSKLPFRNLVRLYNVHLAFTPMILSDSFANSAKARDNEFTTNDTDRPLVAQFAANRIDDFVTAAKLISPFCDGVDLNCGCPQRWAWQEGIGACLIHKPQFVHDLVHQTKNQCPAQLSVSVKIRIHDDVTKTVDFCRQIESAGAEFITVHGRTKEQRAEPVNLQAVRDIKNSVAIPVLANGDVKSLQDAQITRDETGCDGVMSARGMLENPAMFAGYDFTPKACVQDWVRISLETGTHFTCFHHHLMYMCGPSMSRADRRCFNALSSTSAVLDFLQERCDIDL